MQEFNSISQNRKNIFFIVLRHTCGEQVAHRRFSFYSPECPRFYWVSFFSTSATPAVSKLCSAGFYVFYLIGPLCRRLSILSTQPIRDKRKANPKFVCVCLFLVSANVALRLPERSFGVLAQGRRRCLPCQR